MKIGLVLSKPPSYSETFFNSKVKGLLDNGFEVTLFIQRNTSDFKLCKSISAPKVYKRNPLFQFYEFIRVVLKLVIYFKRVYRFIQLELNADRAWKQVFKNIYNNAHILSSNLDWLHFGFATLAIQSEHVAKAIGAKMAVSCRGFDMDVYPLKYKDAYSLLWNNVDKVHVISNYMNQRAIDTGMCKHTPCEIIPPAIKISQFKTDQQNNINSTIKITTIARLHWIKGLVDTIEALSIFKQQGVNFKYSLIGKGPEIQALKFAVHQLNLTSEVTFLGQVKHEDIGIILEETDIYIQYSHSEGFCNAVLEAQAMGLLCVVSDGGALVENVLHKQTGWIVPKRNPEALAKMIMEVIHLPQEEKQGIRNNAKDRVIMNFNLEKQQKEFLEFYEPSSS